MSRVADLVVRCLEAEGVRRIFGIPGEENLDLVDALIDSDIDLIVTRHEEGASLMASMVGRLTGRPGVCLSTLGPGATNMVTGVAEAHLSSTPMIALTGQVRREEARFPRKQYVDLVKLFEPVTKLSLSLRDSSIVPETMAGVFATAVEERPGPVHLEMPEDVMKEEVRGEPLIHEVGMSMAADGGEADVLRELIISSKRPLILAGHGIIRKGACAELSRFAKSWNIPVAMSWMGAGIVPFDDPLSLHTVGLRSLDFMLRAFREADLVIMAGLDIIEFQPAFWNVGVKKRVVHLGAIPLDPAKGFNPHHQVVGDLSLTLLEISANPVGRKNWALDLRGQLHTLLDEIPEDTCGIKPQTVVRCIREALGREDMAICDVGAHLLWMMRLYPAYRENTLIGSNGLIPMGFAIPGAIAAKLTCPERRVVAVCGDGGFLMTSNELETAVREEAPFVTVVFNDSGLGMIKTRQERVYGRNHGVEFGYVDLVGYAESLGAGGFRVTSAMELEEALSSCLESERPCVIDVPVDYSENANLTR